MIPGNATVWTLERNTPQDAPVTLGEIVHRAAHDGDSICATAELPWLDNHPQLSCIPALVYPVTLHPFDSLKLRLHNVPGRELINIEHFNFPIGKPVSSAKPHGPRGKPESEGCVGVGTGYTLARDGVIASISTLKRVRAHAEKCLSHGPLFLSVLWLPPDEL